MSELAEPPEYIDVVELSSRSGLSRSTLWRLKAQRKIPFIQPSGKGGRVLFPRDALERADSTVDPASARDPGENSKSRKLPGPRPRWMTGNHH